MNRFFLRGLPILMLCGCGAGWWLLRSAGVSQSSPGSSSHEMNRLRDTEDFVLLETYEEMIYRILVDFGRKSLTRDRSQQLRLAGNFLEGYVKRYPNDRRTKHPPPFDQGLAAIGIDQPPAARLRRQ